MISCQAEKQPEGKDAHRKLPLILGVEQVDDVAELGLPSIIFAEYTFKKNGNRYIIS